MRALLSIVVATAVLGGCSTVRSGLGGFQKAADKGVSAGKVGPVAVSGGNPDASLVPPGSVAENSSPPAPADRDAAAATAAGGKAAKHGKKGKPAPLPGGLGGDTEHRAYSGDVPKS